MRKVLVVDDEEMWRDALKRIFDDLGCEVDFATDFHEGKARIEVTKYDLIVLDNALDYFWTDAGIELLHVVRKYIITPNVETPIVLHTGDDRDSTKERVKQLGGLYRFKGDSDTLYDFLQALLAGRPIPATSQ